MKILEFEDGMKVVTSGIDFRIGGKSPIAEIPLKRDEFDKVIKNPNLTKNYTKGRIILSERKVTKETA